MTASTMILGATLSAHAGSRPCSLPSILRITKPEANLIYQVDDHAQHKLYTLGEVSKAVSDCNPERTLFIVASPEVPVGRIHSEPKEQIEHVRYFVQYAANDFWELGTNLYFYALPITPDIFPDPQDDEKSPVAPSKLKGKQ